MAYPSYLVHFNKNHDKKGRFTYGDGDGDGKGNDHGRRDGNPTSSDSYRTPELDSINSKYSSILKEADEAESYEFKESNKNTQEKILNMAVTALKNIDANIGAPEGLSALDYSPTGWDNILYEYFGGYRSIAYLATKGYNEKQIKDVIEANHKLSEANSNFTREYVDNGSKSRQMHDRFLEAKELLPYKNANTFIEDGPYYFLKSNPDGWSYKEINNYIDECVKLAKDMEHSDSSDYLVHFNKNHDKLGRFAIGDGDGDGIRDDHANQEKETAGQKIKRAVDTYDSVRSDIRRRSLEDEEYKVKKENLNLRQDQIANQRNQEQTDVKSRNIDLSLQKQDARLQKLQMKNAMREERARAFIEKHRMQQELRAEKQAERTAKAQERAAKAAERNERRELRRQASAQQRAIDQQRREYQAEARRYQATINKYNRGAKLDRTMAMIRLVQGNPIGFGYLGRSIYRSAKAKSLGGE